MGFIYKLILMSLTIFSVCFGSLEHEPMIKEPDKKDYYKLKFSENEIDIDKNGTIDTYLYTTKYINSKISDGNFVNIKGSGISTEGTFYKKVYLTIEVE